MHHRLRSSVLAALALSFVIPAVAAAQSPSVSEQLATHATAINQILVFFAAVLVLFMQAGFAMLEIGLSRMKNAGAVAGKIIINLAISFLMFWAVGFALAFGNGNGFMGTHGWFLDLSDPAGTFTAITSISDTPIHVQFFFQAVFVAISLAIVFGAMLDRTKFAAYIVFGVVYTGVIYPIVAHWTWGGGWLGQQGFLDFAGSSIVHLQGALAALVGTMMLGPRIGKFFQGKAVPIPGHSIPLAVLGVLILWVGWMGFNPGSALNAVGVDFADVAVNTNLAAAAGVLGATIAAAALFRTLDVSQIANGAIAGLVAITAPCAFVDPWAAVVIGGVAGLLVPPLVLLVDRLRIDDPIGCLPVHGIAGIWGTLAIGLFATADRTVNAGLGTSAGLFLGGSGSQLWVQTFGVLVTMAFTGGSTVLLFALIRKTVGLRISEEHEIAGQDISEHGMFGYPERFIDVPGAEPVTVPGSAIAMPIPTAPKPVPSISEVAP